MTETAVANRAGTREGLVAAFFRPRSIAIYGASNDPVKLSGRTLAYLRTHGYPGEIYPINANRDVVQGIPAFPDIDAVPGPVDLAILVVPSTATPAALRRCAARNVPAAMLFAAGFGEIGEEGADLEAEVAALVAETGIRVLGPNCLGAIVPGETLTASFTSALDEVDLVDGNVAFVTQSGAFGSTIFAAMQGSGLGISHFVNTGNEVDLTVAEVAGALLEEPDVDVVVGYSEGVKDGEVLLRTALRALELDTPMALVKVGRSDSGKRAAVSHTGTLAGEDAVYDGVFRQFGIFRPDGMEPLIDVARMFATKRRMAGRRVTIVTLSGGAGVLMADVCGDLGLEVAPWEGRWRERMAQIIPPYGSATNPIDVTATLIAQLDLLEQALTLCMDHPATDAIVVMLGNVAVGEDELVAALERVNARTDKPLVVTWAGGTPRPIAKLTARRIPSYSDPSRALRALAALADYSEYRKHPPPVLPVPGDGPRRRTARQHAGLRLVADARSRESLQLDEYEGKRLLAAYGVRTAAERVADSPAAAVDAAVELGLPVAVKLLSPEVAHKTEAGGVCLNLEDKDAVLEAAERLRQVGMHLPGSDGRLLVQRMVPPGLELVLGVKWDAVFGAVVLVGFGGTLTEVVADRSIARPPLDVDGAHRLLDRLSFASLFDGIRGGGAYDREAAAQAVSAIADLASELGDEIAELEVNPLIVGLDGQGAVAVDALVIVSSTRSSPSAAREE